MAEVASGSARLVLTGPPYFPPECEAALQRGRLGDERAIAELTRQIEVYAFAQRAVFRECHRILRPGGTLIMQTRDVRLESVLVPVESLHRQIAEGCGFQLYTRHLWRPHFVTDGRYRITRSLEKLFGPLPLDPEVFLVFRLPGPLLPLNASKEDAKLLRQDYLTSNRGRLKSPHRFQAPLALLRAMIRTHSLADELVVDPYAGGGTTLYAAALEKRLAVGYEIDPVAASLARENLGLWNS
jgi:tRNA1(Val) A37 N6-methylase TrmN6